MLVWFSVVGGPLSTPQGPFQLVGSSKLLVLSTCPAAPWGPGWQDRLTTLPTSPLPSSREQGYPVDVLSLGSGGQG